MTEDIIRANVSARLLSAGILAFWNVPVDLACLAALPPLGKAEVDLVMVIDGNKKDIEGVVFTSSIEENRSRRGYLPIHIWGESAEQRRRTKEVLSGALFANHLNYYSAQGVEDRVLLLPLNAPRQVTLLDYISKYSLHHWHVWTILSHMN